MQGFCPSYCAVSPTQTGGYREVWHPLWHPLVVLVVGGGGWSVRWLSYAGAMARMEIELPDDVAERVIAAAAIEGIEPAALASKLVCESYGPRRKLSFVAIGRSTSGDRAADDEKLLAEGFGSEHRRADR